MAIAADQSMLVFDPPAAVNRTFVMGGPSDSFLAELSCKNAISETDSIREKLRISKARLLESDLRYTETYQDGT